MSDNRELFIGSEPIDHGMIQSYQMVKYVYAGDLSANPQIQLNINHSQSSWTDLSNAHIDVKCTFKKNTSTALAATDEFLVMNSADLISEIGLSAAGNMISSTRQPGIVKVLLDSTKYKGNREQAKEIERCHFASLENDTKLWELRKASSGTISATYTDDLSGAAYTGGFSELFTGVLTADTTKTMATPRSFELKKLALKHSLGTVSFRIFIRDIIGFAQLKKLIRGVQLSLHITLASAFVQRFVLEGAVASNHIDNLTFNNLSFYCGRVELTPAAEVMMSDALKSGIMLNWLEYSCQTISQSASTGDRTITAAQTTSQAVPRFIICGYRPAEVAQGSAGYLFNQYAHLPTSMSKIYCVNGGKTQDVVESEFSEYYRFYDLYLQCLPALNKDCVPLSYYEWKKFQAVVGFNLYENKPGGVDAVAGDVVQVVYTDTAGSAHLFDILVLSEVSYMLRWDGVGSVQMIRS